MSVNAEVKKRFLISTDDTGRFIVKSTKTGIAYFVEPIDDGAPPDWGDVDLITKKTTGSYGQKHKGAVRPSDSLISKENGFENVVSLSPGKSPMAHINHTDDVRYNEGYRPN